MDKRRVFVFVGIGAAAMLRLLQKRREELVDLRGQTALVTGSSRGLGFLLARELAREGCRVVLCARNEAELARAQRDLEQEGARVLAVRCDVSDQAEVTELIATATAHFGPIDILVNNAGIIQVGPLQNIPLADFEQAMGTMLWGTIYPTLGVLPAMRARRRGRIVNITSIGGKASVPHLLPYGTAKFAAVGFSEGLRAELAGSGVSVTTIVPGLMRTGSYLRALFRGRRQDEFTWFSLGSALPLISMDAERAAQQIVAAMKRGEAERILSLPAQVLARFHGLFPGMTTQILGVVASLLPAPAQVETEPLPGLAVRETLSGSRRDLLGRLTVLGERAARRFHQYME